MATPRVITWTEAEAWKKLLSNEQVKADFVKDGGNDPGGQESILTSLNKYIPATVIVLYMFLDVIFKALTDPPVLLWLVIFFIMLAGAGVLTYQITKDPGLPDSVRNRKEVHALIKELELIINRQRLKQAVVAAIAFAGYVLAIGGPFANINGCKGSLSCQISFMPDFIWQPYYGAVGLVLATLAVAILVGKDILAE